MPSITRRGALSVTTDIDRIANVIQTEHAALGIPKEYALKYAYYCDVVSDRIEKHAVKVAEDAGEEAPKDEEKKAEEAKPEEDAEKKEASRRLAEDEKLLAEMEEEEQKKEASKKRASKKRADDETGLSVDHGASGFDANTIADDVGGPQEILAPIEAWMNSYFAQDWFHELDDLQTAGEMSNAAARGQIITKSASRLRRFVADSGAKTMSDLVRALKASQMPILRKAEEEPKEDDEAKKEASQRRADDALLRKMLAEEEAKAEDPKKDEAKKEASRRLAEDNALLRKMLAEEEEKAKDEEPKKEASGRRAEEEPKKDDEEPKKEASTHGYNLFAK